MLVPLLPFSLELMALRRMRVAAFGTLMALEPGIAAVIGLVLLSQLPDGWQAAGVVLVVIAGIGAQRGPRLRPTGRADRSASSHCPQPVAAGRAVTARRHSLGPMSYRAGRVGRDRRDRRLRAF